MRIIGLANRLKRLNKEEFIADWHAGMSWADMRAKYRIGSYRLFEIAKEFGLPPRKAGPYKATDLSRIVKRHNDIMPLIINDYINGMSRTYIEKRYRIGLVTFRDRLRKYDRLRRHAMKANLKKKRREAKNNP